MDDGEPWINFRAALLSFLLPANAELSSVRILAFSCTRGLESKIKNIREGGCRMCLASLTVVVTLK